MHQLFTDYLLQLPSSELLEKHLFRSRADRRLVLIWRKGGVGEVRLRVRLRVRRSLLQILLAMTTEPEADPEVEPPQPPSTKKNSLMG